MSFNSSRKASLKLPGLPKNIKVLTKAEHLLRIPEREQISIIGEKEVQSIFSKKKDTTHIDFSSPTFQLESCSFLRYFPETTKECVFMKWSYYYWDI